MLLLGLEEFLVFPSVGDLTVANVDDVDCVDVDNEVFI